MVKAAIGFEPSTGNSEEPRGPSSQPCGDGKWPMCCGQQNGQSGSPPANINHHLVILRQLPINIDENSVAMAWESTLLLARQHMLISFDATYLELATRTGLPLAMMDKISGRGREPKTSP